MIDGDDDCASVRQGKAAVRAWRERRIEAFKKRQRQCREWIGFAEIADLVAREGGSIVPDEQRRKRAYAELAAALLRGDFDHGGRSRVLFLSKYSSLARMTPEWLREIQTIKGWVENGTVDRQYLAASDAAALAASDDYEARLVALLDRAPRMADGTRDVLDPLALPLHRDARVMWTRFHDAVERELRADGAFAAIRAFGAKAAEHAARIAAVLSVYADREAGEVSRAAMAGGIMLAQHYAAEMARMANAAAVAPDLLLANRLLSWWQARAPAARRVHLATLYQRGLNAVGDAATARRLVAVLEEHGWITRLPPGTEIDGAPRREAWELVA